MKKLASLISVVIVVLTVLCVSARSEGATTIKVSNSREFLEALGSDRIIELSPGEYNLSEWDPFLNNQPEQAPPYPNLGNEGEPKLAEGVSWSDYPFDGGELVLSGINDLTIRSTGKGPDTLIVIDPRYAYVLKFFNCNGIVIENIAAGHSEGGYCSGGVFGFEGSSRITITGSNMFGCGTEGLVLSNVSDMNVTTSRIYECTYDVMTVEGGENIAFKSCAFSDNQEFSLVNITGTRNISFADCEFRGNRGSSMFAVQDTTVSVSNSAFIDNHISFPIQDSDNVEFVNCTFNDVNEEKIPVNVMTDSDFVDLCAEGSLEQIVEAVKNGANVNAKGDDNEMTPLMTATWREDEDSIPAVIAALIEAGADVNARNVDGMTPLMWTAHRVNNSKVSAALIEAGADASARCNEGNTALIWAEMGASSPEIITVLVNAGVDVNASNNDGYTALIFAAGSNPNLQVTINLIKAGANVNASNNNGKTPLMWAARWNSNPEVTVTLLNHGADPKIKDNSGKTALDYAKENENLFNTDALRELKEANSAETTPSQEENGDEKIEGEVKLTDVNTGNTKPLSPPFSEEDRGLLFYHNDQFEYSVMIPGIFTEVVLLPDNEDGLILKSKNEEYRFRASGGYMVFENQLQTSMEAAKKYVNENVDGAIINEKTGDDWWELNWWNGHEKGVRKFMTNGEVWCECEITSPDKPQNEKGEYDELFERSLATMSFPVG